MGDEVPENLILEVTEVSSTAAEGPAVTVVNVVSIRLVDEVSVSSIVEVTEVSRTAVEGPAVSTILQEEVQTPEELITEVEVLLDSTIPIEEVGITEDLNTVAIVSEVPMCLPEVSQEVMEVTRADPSKSEAAEEVSTCQTNVVSANLSKVSDNLENAVEVSNLTRTTTVSKVSEIKSNEARRNSDVDVKGIDEMLDVVADNTANLTMEKKSQGMDTTDAKILDTFRKRTPRSNSDASSRYGPEIEPTPPPPHNG